MKKLSKMLLLSLTIATVSYPMENAVEDKVEDNSLRDELFEENIKKLSRPIADFVHDFKTWPKKEQDKINVYNNGVSQGFGINGRPAATDKYEGSIGYYLDCRLTQRQITPFVVLIDHIKKQN